MGMPIPRSFYTQVSQESPLWDDPSGLERRVAPVSFVGHKFWARGYFVSTVGINEKVIRAYIENQEKEDKRWDDLFDR